MWLVVGGKLGERGASSALPCSVPSPAPWKIKIFDFKKPIKDVFLQMLSCAGAGERDASSNSRAGAHHGALSHSGRGPPPFLG